MEVGPGGTLMWEGGLTLNYTNWAPGEPSSHIESCLSLWDGVQYKWNDDLCDRGRKFICERSVFGNC